MSKSKKAKGLKTTADGSIDKSMSADSKILAKSTSRNSSASSVKPDDTERRDGPGGN